MAAYLRDRRPGSVLNSDGDVHHVSGRIDPNHEAGIFFLFCSSLYFVYAGLGEVDGGGLEKAVEFTQVVEILYGHGGSPSSREIVAKP